VLDVEAPTWIVRDESGRVDQRREACSNGACRRWSALLGAITIGSISYGMELLARQSSVKDMVTGGVLVAAVIGDALARGNRQARA